MTLSRMALSFLLGLSASGAWSDVYIYVDQVGVTHYTNRPDHEAYQLIIDVLEEVGTSNRAQTKPLKGGVAKYAPIVDEVAEVYEIDRALVHAVITAESGYNPSAVSRAGAQGLMQLMPETAKRYAVVDAFDPAQNVRGGVRYLRDLLVLFDNNVELAVAAYNAGENAVLRHGRQIPPYRETKAYVPKVLALYEKYRSLL